MRDVAPGSPGACGAFALFNASSTDPALVTLRPTPPTMIESLDGDDRTPSCGTTSAGVASGCQDFGVGSPGRWRQLYHLPKKLPRAPSATVQSDAAELHAHLSMRQLQPSGSCNGPVYTVAELPTIGFCALMEFALLELARAASLGSRLVLGPNTALAWTSTWLCGRDRSLSCYFDLSGGCCAEASSFARAAAASDGGRAGGIHPGKRIQRRQVAASAGGRQAAKILRKAGLNERVTYGYSRAVTLGGPLARFNRFGGAWVHGQLALWLMRRIKPSIRDELDRRRATVLPRRRGASGWQDTSATPPTPLAGMAMAEACISMHVRRGDSCALGSRFCPANRTAAYFEAAATLRTRYGLNRLVLATDDVAAAELCAQRVLGFDCATMRMDRQRFASRTSIERRVVHHDTGVLSGARVALDTLADVEMLSECAAHVLVLRSAVSRLALGLSIARKGAFPPTISLQWPWGGMPTGPPA